jgi:hypothetical protein
MLVRRTIHPLFQTREVLLLATSFNGCSKKRLHQTANLRATESDVSVARKWLAELHEASLPSSIGEVSYSRSSGPGGQNVNKFVSQFGISSLILTLM